MAIQTKPFISFEETMKKLGVTEKTDSTPQKKIEVQSRQQNRVTLEECIESVKSLANIRD